VDTTGLTPEQVTALESSGLTTEQQGQLADQWRTAAAERAAADTGIGGPQVPKVDHAPQTPEDVQALAQEFAQYRKEMSELREELRKSRLSPKFLTAVPETEEDRQKARLADIANHEFYCPGCGSLYDYPQKCNGATPATPHPPIEVVSTQELAGDPEGHTAAPDAAPAGVA
jgi:hypothetical protein